MDPVACLLEQRMLAESLLNEFDADNAIRLAELVLALDNWRRSGGFDPYAEQPEIVR